MTRRTGVNIHRVGRNDFMSLESNKDSFKDVSWKTLYRNISDFHVGGLS